MKKGESGVCLFLPRINLVAGRLTSVHELILIPRKSVKNNQHSSFLLDIVFLIKLIKIFIITRMKKGESGVCFFLSRTNLVAGRLTSVHELVLIPNKTSVKINPTHSNFFLQWIYALSIPLTHTQLKPPSVAYKRRCISGMRVKPHPLIKPSF